LSLWSKKNAGRPGLNHRVTVHERSICSTLVESALQIHPFFAKRTQFPKSQMDSSYYITREYEHMDTWSNGKNEPKTNPIKANKMPKQSQYKPKTNPISDGGQPSSVDSPFTSGLTEQAILVIVRPFLCIAKWFGMLDCVFSGLRQ